MIKSMFVLNILSVTLLTTMASAQTEVPAPLNSRTCGKILIAEGRAQLQLRNFENARDDFVSGLALLHDSPDVEMPRQIAVHNSIHSADSATAIQCRIWLGYRKTQPDFDHSEAYALRLVKQAEVLLNQ